MKGSKIQVTGTARGVTLSGIISGTPTPGHLMQIKAATVLVNGLPTFEVAAPSGGDGKPLAIMVLLEDEEQGKTYSDAYVSGRLCKVYCPLAGEQLNVRVGEAGGTGNTLAIGDLLMPDAEDGLLIPNSSGVCVPFQVLETITLAVDDTLVHCLCTGH